MTSAILLRHRVHNQRLAVTNFEDPADPVRWLGAVQAQDYLGSLWAIGLRTRAATEKMVERAIAEGTIVRTWPMRGTLHFVAAEDARWMLELMTPRVVAASAGRLEREYDLDQKVVGRSGEIVTRALEGGRRLTRDALYRALENGRISTAAGRGLHITWRMAHDGLICFGPREGRQQTFVLLHEWVPGAKRMARDEALAELARRYFTSRGPATVHDFAWWSGLLLSDAVQGLAMASRALVSVDLADRKYWSAPSAPPGGSSPRAFLLPAFDEYTVAYRDRAVVLGPAHTRQAGSMDVLRPAIVVNGRVVGTWARTLGKSSVEVDASPFTRLAATTRRAVAAAARRYAAFLERSADAS
jgi:winged helix DNA-binding protein